MEKQSNIMNMGPSGRSMGNGIGFSDKGLAVSLQIP